MKSSKSSSQLTDGGAVGGAALLDEPLDFSFLSFLVLGSCTWEGTSGVWGHDLGGHEVVHIVIPVNTSWCLRWCSMTWRISGHLFLQRPRTSLNWTNFDNTISIVPSADTSNFLLITRCVMISKYYTRFFFGPWKSSKIGGSHCLMLQYLETSLILYFTIQNLILF